MSVKKSAGGRSLAAVFLLLVLPATFAIGQTITSRPPDAIGPNSRIWYVGATNSSITDAPTTASTIAAPALNAFAGATLDQESGPPAVSGGGSRIEEIETGMNYWTGEQWLPSEPSFDVAADGFIATRLQFIVNINAQINTSNAVNILTRDGNFIRSTPVALALYDRASGASIIIGAITNSTGVLVETNRILFENCFHGAGINADLVYSIQKGTFEQDLVLRSRLDPADYQFPRETTSIQVITEVYEAPVPDRIRRPLYIEENEALRNQMASPDIVDEVLGFGEFVLGSGRAFNSDFDASPTNAAASVAKEMRSIAGRTFWVESVEFKQVSAHLEALPIPSPQEAALRKRRGNQKSNIGYAAIPKPAARVKQQAKRDLPGTPDGVKRGAFLKRRGLIIDYTTVVGSTVTNTTFFSGDCTFLINGAVIYNGPVTIEGGGYLEVQASGWVRFRVPQA